MINNNSPLIRCLIELGMSEREARVYLALLKKRRSNTADLQRISGVPQSKIYQTVNSLVRGGYFSERRQGRNRTFEIIDPKVSLTSSFVNLEKRLKGAKKQRKEIETLFEKSVEVSEPFEYIEIIHNNENIHAKYVNLLRDSKQEYLCFIRAPFAWYTDEMKHEQINEFRAFEKRGGVSRWVYELNDDAPSFLFEAAVEDAHGGEKFRISDSLPLKIMIFDRQTLLIADEEQILREGELTMAIIKQATTVKGYTALFNFFWDQALEFEEWKKLHEDIIDKKLQTSP